ncbi:hypothetical protein IEQ34_006146 [Dendrobium chrysotoxum]|uniref:Uncharacterized protein n=1 Tax=Dendrobium chrysotoxum TaxID=161865 RepID=A0AAV7HEM9_DENCH|nr:hypothetical protein IEQ34_006146 [Dendrobium chrysotoxum]
MWNSLLPQTANRTPPSSRNYSVSLPHQPVEEAVRAKQSFGNIPMALRKMRKMNPEDIFEFAEFFDLSMKKISSERKGQLRAGIGECPIMEKPSRRAVIAGNSSSPYSKRGSEKKRGPPGYGSHEKKVTYNRRRVQVGVEKMNLQGDIIAERITERDEGQSSRPIRISEDPENEIPVKVNIPRVDSAPTAPGSCFAVTSLLESVRRRECSYSRSPPSKSLHNTPYFASLYLIDRTQKLIHRLFGRTIAENDVSSGLALGTQISFPGHSTPPGRAVMLSDEEDAIMKMIEMQLKALPTIPRAESKRKEILEEMMRKLMEMRSKIPPTVLITNPNQNLIRIPLAKSKGKEIGLINRHIRSFILISILNFGSDTILVTTRPDKLAIPLRFPQKLPVAARPKPLLSAALFFSFARPNKTHVWNEGTEGGVSIVMAIGQGRLDRSAQQAVEGAEPRTKSREILTPVVWSSKAYHISFSSVGKFTLEQQTEYNGLINHHDVLLKLSLEVDAAIARLSKPCVARVSVNIDAATLLKQMKGARSLVQTGCPKATPLGNNYFNDFLAFGGIGRLRKGANESSRARVRPNPSSTREPNPKLKLKLELKSSSKGKLELGSCH